MQIKDSKASKNKNTFNSLMKERSRNEDFRAQVSLMKQDGLNVADIHFSRIAMSSQERKSLTQAPLPIELEQEKNKKKEPKKYAQEMR